MYRSKYTLKKLHDYLLLHVITYKYFVFLNSLSLPGSFLCPPEMIFYSYLPW